MPVRSKQLGGTVNINVTSTAVYTAQSGETTIVKSAVVYNRHATVACQVTLCRGTAAGQGQNQTFFNQLLQPRECVRVELWMIVAAGGSISAIASQAASASVYLSGAELEGVAD